MQPSREQCFWAQNRIEASIDNELCDTERELFDRHIASCDWCRKELAFARSIAGELRAFSPLRCPESVMETAAARTAISSSRGTGKTRFERARMRSGWLFSPVPVPALTVLLVIIIAASFFTLRHDRTQVQNNTAPVSAPDEMIVSAEEASMVIDEVALAFSYVNKYSLRTREVTQQGAILDRVMKSVYETVIKSMSPFPIKE